MWRALFTLLVACTLSGCGNGKPTGEQAVGENTQLRQQIEDKKVEVAQLNKRIGQLQEENARLQAQHAAVTGAAGLSAEDQQRLLDGRKAAIDKRDQDVTAREVSVERQVAERRLELQKEYASRLDAVMHREQAISAKEGEFYKATNMTMKDVGEAQHIKAEYDGMRSERDEARGTADRWLRFIWWVSIAFGLTVIVLATVVVVAVSRHLTAAREAQMRRDMATVLSSAIQAQLPNEQGALVADAFSRLAQLPSRSVEGS